MRHVAVASTVGAVIMLFTGFAVASEDVTPESRSAGQEIYARSLPAIVTLESRNKDGSSSIGSAFLAIRDGVAVTAWHTVGDALEVIARFSSGEVFEVSGLIDKDERRDVALIRIKVFGRPLLSLSADEPAIGSRAYVIGAPRGLEYTISEGIVSQKQLVEGIEQYQFSCAASPGNSGGPLLDDKGVVLGVVSWQMREGQNLNFASPSKYVLGLDPSLPTTPWDNVRTATGLAIGAKTSDAAIDEALARALVVWLDAETAIRGASIDIVWRQGGYRSGVPAYLYRSEREIKESATALGRMRPDDPVRESARVRALKRFGNIRDCLDLEMKAIRSAAVGRGWTAEAQDLYNRAVAAYVADAPIDSTESALFKKSPTIAKLIPREALLRAGLAEDSTAIDLGIESWTGDPLAIIGVQEGSLAEKLGLKAGDVLLAVDGHRVGSLENLRDVLSARSNKNVALAITRKESSIVLRRKVPGVLPTAVRRVAGMRGLATMSSQRSAPVTLRLEGGMLVEAQTAEPWSNDMIKVVDTGGGTSYISLSKIQGVILSDGVDVTTKVVRDRKRVP